MDIKSLQDYPALQQLANALWRVGTSRGAALLVGAGFSKYAERPAADTPEPPLWTDFAKIMASALYPSDSDQVPRDPLRLAEEYKAYFGRAALDELIRIHINDGAWQPGILHKDILNLEWSDVLTTNWDTLLERTAVSVVSRSYEIVRSEADLAHTRSPRIVKLHGSVGASDRFIVTEEDYRTYPTKFAAFVNFSRQVFIENELCLIGFSGDDPNFLEWSGWVRDNLGDSARRIYLVGALNMGSAKRKLLESRNVVPIDLAPLAPENHGGNPHEAAIAAFINFLVKSRPLPSHEWKPVSITEYRFLPKTSADHARLRDPAYAASILDQAGNIWAQDRETYPGWLVCPAHLRARIVRETDFCPINGVAIEALQPPRQAEILYEITWRKKISFSPVSADLAHLISKIAYPNVCQYLDEHQRIEVTLFLLKTARLADDATSFNLFANCIAERVEPLSDWYADLAYQRALYARDRMDFPAMMAELSKIVGQDPIWSLRRAALLAEAGELDQASQLVLAGQSDLQKREKRDPTSLWIKSRRAWAEWVARAIRLSGEYYLFESNLSLEFKRIYCDPGEEVDNLTNFFAGELRKLREDGFSSIPPFRAGEYRARSNAIFSVIPSSRNLIISLDDLMITAGFPMRLDHVNLVASAALDVAQLCFNGTVQWYVWVVRALNVPWGNVFEIYFSRVKIASLSQEIVDILLMYIRNNIDYWIKKISGGDLRERVYGIGRLRLLIEILARLTVRQNPQVARTHLKIAERIVQGPLINHGWINESLSHLLENSIKLIRSIEEDDLIFSLLEFPMSKDSIKFPHSLPEPFDYLLDTKIERSTNSRWNVLIARLIHNARPGTDFRPTAIFRLFVLYRCNILASTEANEFATALWATIDSISGLPSDTYMLPYVFADLPAPTNVDNKKLVGHYLFDAHINEIFEMSNLLNTNTIGAKVNFLQSLVASASSSIRPTSKQSLKLFDEIVSWRAKGLETVKPFAAEFSKPVYERAGRYLGDILRFVVTPNLDSVDKTLCRARKLLEFISEVKNSTAIGALPYFIGKEASLDDDIVRLIERSLVGRSEELVAGGAGAIELWAVNSLCADGIALPPRLTDRIVSAIEAGRETGLLSILACAVRLVEANAFSDTEKSRIAQVLGEMTIQYQYQNIDPDSNRAIIASLVRAQCVKIADALQKVGYTDAYVTKWLCDAMLDPLPEVRLALGLCPSTGI